MATRTHEIVAVVDGSSEGNNQKEDPRRAGVGIVYYEDGEEIFDFKEHVGDRTNGDAEHLAVFYALKELASWGKAGDIDLLIQTDSQNIAKQHQGDYRCNKDEHRAILQEANELKKAFRSVRVEWKSRNKTVKADKLAKAAASGEEGE